MLAGVLVIEMPACNVITAVADFAGFWRLLAVTFTVAGTGIDEGAVYKPVEEIVPIAGLIDQEIPRFCVPPTKALKSWVCPADKVTLVGPTRT